MTGEHRISRGQLVASMSSKTNWTPDGCALWTASVDSDGYPRVYVGFKFVNHPIMLNATRVHYEVHHGIKLDRRVHLNNTCGNRRCMAHVEPGGVGEAGGKAAHAAATQRNPDGFPYCDHPRTEENILRRPDGRSSGCRVCRDEYQRRYNHERRGRKPNRRRGAK